MKTLLCAVEEFLASQAGEVAASTREWYGRRLAAFCDFVGPEASNRKSLAMRVRSPASVRSAPLKWTASAMLCIDSNLSLIHI